MSKSKKVVILGASGFVGSFLVTRLLQENLDVISISGQSFDDSPQDYDAVISGSDYLINLCGESVGTPIWTGSKRKKIQESRIELTKKMIDLFQRISNPPSRFLCASAIGYYGDRGDELLTETSSCGVGFLSTLCKNWEEQSLLAKNLGIATCCMRFGTILDKSGGILRAIKKVSFWGTVLGVCDKGQQISWVYMEDVVNSILFLIRNKEIQGPVNIVGGSSSITAFYRWATSVWGMRLLGMLENSYLRSILFKTFGSSMELFFFSQNVFSQQLTDAGFLFKKDRLT